MKDLFNGIECKIGEELKFHTTFHVGGIANYFLYPKSCDEIFDIVNLCKQKDIKYFILGNGSNVLFDDLGYNGAIISMQKMNSIEVLKENEKYVDLRIYAGVNLFYLHKYCSDNKLYGLEWAYGIPASFGGLVKMNGGAYEHEIGEYVLRVGILENGYLKVKDVSELQFSYRHTNLEGVIIYVEIRLKKDFLYLKFENRNVDKIKRNVKNMLKKCKKLIKNAVIFEFFDNFSVDKLQKVYFDKKRNSQPCQSFSAGSVYKRGKDFFPAKIIDDLRLKGFSINDAEISQKHAGFIINKQNASSNDILCVMQFVEDKAKELGYNFEREIIVVPYD